jgi:hypothetical protein
MVDELASRDLIPCRPGLSREEKIHGISDFDMGLSFHDSAAVRPSRSPPSFIEQVVTA